jgi:hypothetical protein
MLQVLETLHLMCTLIYFLHISLQILNGIVMNQVGNSNFPPSVHLIFFFLPTYAMKITPAKFKNGQERVIVPR